MWNVLGEHIFIFSFVHFCISRTLVKIFDTLTDEFKQNAYPDILYVWLDFLHSRNTFPELLICFCFFIDGPGFKPYTQCKRVLLGININICFRKKDTTMFGFSMHCVYSGSDWGYSTNMRLLYISNSCKVL